MSKKMTHLTKDMLADLSTPAPFDAQPSQRFKRLSNLRSYAAAGRGPIVDTPAWDPDDEAVSGSFTSR